MKNVGCSSYKSGVKPRFTAYPNRWVVVCVVVLLRTTTSVKKGDFCFGEVALSLKTKVLLVIAVNCEFVAPRLSVIFIPSRQRRRSECIRLDVFG